MAQNNIVVPSAVSTSTFPSSGVTTFGKMKSNIATILGVDGDARLEEQAGNFIRDIIDELNIKQVWRFNLVTSSPITTVAGQSDYDMPADFWKIYNARKTDGIDYMLTTLQQYDFDMLFVSQRNINGFPYILVIKNTFRDGTFMLFPTPDGTYTIELNYFKFIGKPPNDSTALDLPQPYQVIPKYGSTSRLSALVSNWQGARYWQALYDNAYREMKKSDEDDGDEELRFIQIEEMLARSYSFINPASRPRALDLF